MDSDNDSSFDFKKVEKLIEKEYPEAYIYYNLGKMFGWTPQDVDKLDFDLCRILIALDEERNRKEEEDYEKEGGGGGSIKSPHTSKSSFPEDWKDMSVKDILNTNEYKKKEIENSILLEAMKRTVGGQTGVIKNYINIKRG